MVEHKTKQFPKSRIATIDIGTVGKLKHHVAAMIEIDVTSSRNRLKILKSENKKISFLSWLIKVIGHTMKKHEFVAAYLKGKRQVIIFNDINISIVVEKSVEGHKVPIPLVINKANERSIESITKQINDAVNKEFTDEDIVLQKKAGRIEKLYYSLPGILRRKVWNYILRHPQFAYNKMGNAAITSVGMSRNIKGWFIPISVHPVCFGISKINSKPWVVDGEIQIREILNMTVLMDHDVTDGIPMARFISDLTENIEKGLFLNQ